MDWRQMGMVILLALFVLLVSTTAVFMSREQAPNRAENGHSTPNSPETGRHQAG